MSLLARGIALQGFLLSPVAMAVQGLLQQEGGVIPVLPIAQQVLGGQGVLKVPRPRRMLRPAVQIKLGRPKKKRQNDLLFFGQ